MTEMEDSESRNWIMELLQGGIELRLLIGNISMIF